MPFAPAEGTEIYYEVHGQGPHVVMCHGIGSNRLHWWQQVATLRKEFTVVVFDHRGFGDSRSGGHGASKFVDDLEKLLDHIGIEHAHLIAQSMGGLTAVGFTERHPNRIRSLVLSSATGGLIRPPPNPTLVAAVQKATSYLELLPALARQDEFPQRQPELSFLFEEMSQLNRGVEIKLLLGEMMQLKPDLERFVSAKFPLLLLAGSDDHTNVTAMKELAKAKPGTTFECIESAGHLLFFEQAASFNAHILAFLREHAVR